MPMVNQGLTSPTQMVVRLLNAAASERPIFNRERMESRVNRSIESIGDHPFSTAKKFNMHFNAA